MKKARAAGLRATAAQKRSWAGATAVAEVTLRSSWRHMAWTTWNSRSVGERPGRGEYQRTPLCGQQTPYIPTYKLNTLCIYY